MKNIQKVDEYIMCNEDSIYFFYDDEFQSSKWVKFKRMKERYLIANTPTFIMIFTLIFDTFVLFYNLKTKSLLNLIGTLIFILFASLKIFNFIYKAVMLKFGNSSWRLTARLHGAMHMVLNAYADNGYLPSFEELKTYNYTLSECNTFFPLTKILVITYFFIMTFFTSNIWLLLITSVILYVILIILDSNNILQHFQKLAVSDPTDIELKYVLKKVKSLDEFVNSCYDYLDSSNDDSK